jgi:hypothetical protein
VRLYIKQQYLDSLMKKAFSALRERAALQHRKKAKVAELLRHNADVVLAQKILTSWHKLTCHRMHVYTGL